MYGAVTDHPKVLPKPRVLQHRGSISAYQHWHSRPEDMVVVKRKGVRRLRNGAQIERNLPIVLADVFQRQLEGPDG
jgi:hypothetical protein